MRSLLRLKHYFCNNIMENKAKSIIITGSNKGIGYGIVQGLAQHPKAWKIYMACRNLELANNSRTELLSKFPEASIETLELDVSSNDSIDKFISNLQNKNISVDVLVNNAGIAWKGDAFDYDIVKATFQTNFFGTVYLIQKILPLLNNNGKIIIVGSMIGKYSRLLKSQELIKRWKKQNISREELFANVDHFISSVKDETFLDKGYIRSAYGTSKLSINIYANVLSRSQQVINKNIQVYALCPGYVSTDMSSHKGHLTIQQGAQTPLFLINLPFEPNAQYQGKFFEKSALSNID